MQKYRGILQALFSGFVSNKITIKFASVHTDNHGKVPCCDESAVTNELALTAEKLTSKPFFATCNLYFKYKSQLTSTSLQSLQRRRLMRNCIVKKSEFPR